MRPVIPYVTAALLFGLGVYGVLRRRNAVLVLMAVELMLNAVNLILVTADTTVRAQLPHGGQVFALFVIVLAAAEIGVGLAIVLQLYRLRATVAVDEVPLTEPSPTERPAEPAVAGVASRADARPGNDARPGSADRPEGER
ncbi:NADH-quinone oxidoreductase subunit NuoK [Micromonospora peucetia]|uniref:NADH-quinone oxidoreductase subunit K n=1 Tax=Micromonospora peucetia TaxID=47871 RepID=A0A1C6V923_9ACTN|nr:NADH-quinone oxidoreductase subunit NuoK [Micromonospora peucetia]MCX4389376.1 NADH-quinone oxidoreductase subunit NuoK [Micromonospora peucetia]WSA29873.1 NADH-quinone oxidoreductase subunit NuoK [Micromonospora peucetia]SCL62574.1 NADH dehydrogenase subunit K [Micromonospora peucetia]